MQDNSLQTRTKRSGVPCKGRDIIKEISRMSVFNKPLLEGLISSHPTQDVILRILALITCAYLIDDMIFYMCGVCGVLISTLFSA
ncbi:hypothetical protein D3M71_23845 [Erwinia billingiae]|nr:hypothetical protein [Erwinia billingiae]